jgi:hypothetical protein
MKTSILSLAGIALVVIFSLSVVAQGVPPGWDFLSTPTTHIISIPLSANPNINDFPLKPGDWIGVFYTDDNGELACGGAVEWTGNQNTGIIAFGNDSFTPAKDGFASGEIITYKVYSWSVEQQYDSVIVTCNDNLPNTCLTYVANGLSGLATLDAFGYYLVVEASDELVCSGNSVQLNAIPSGGTGSYTFNWYSVPPGFTSNIANPQVVPDVSTLYFAQVVHEGESLTASVYVEVVLPPESAAGGDQTICADDVAQLNGSIVNADSSAWSTSGDGFFSDPFELTPLYTPGAGDIAAGFVELCLTATGSPACQDVTDCLILDIDPLPDVTLPAYPGYCAGDDPVMLFGGMPEGGTYFIDGTATTLFNPEEPGVYELVYEYTDPNGCSNSASEPIDVNPLPVLECPDDFLVCCDSGPVILDLAIPEGGIYAGTGVIDNVFYPDCASIGDFEITYTYTDPSTSCQNICVFIITVASLPQVTCPGDFEVCINDQPFVLSGATPPGGTYTGTGITANNFNPAIAGVGNHQVTYLFTDANGCSDTCSFYIQVNPLPSVNAGFPVVFIVLPEITVSLTEATAQFYDLIEWSTSGTGTFDDPGLINPVYTLSDDDILEGTVILTMAGINECGTVYDDLIVVINECQPALVDAGNDTTICEDAVYAITDAYAQFYSTLYWSNNQGDGSFNDSTLLNPVYTPGPDDIDSGSVLLTLTAFPLEPCDTISDHKLLNIQKLPTVEAGNDQTICEDDHVVLSGNATGYASVLWTTDGDGTFSDATNPETLYYPGPNDILQQEVSLALQVSPVSPCTGNLSDQVAVGITRLPQVNAGDDATIVAGDTYQMNATASNYLLVLWSTSGDGAFSAYDVLNPVYTPGELDIQNAGATLTLAAFPQAPCSLQTLDHVELSIDTTTNVYDVQKLPVFNVYPNPAITELVIEGYGMDGKTLSVEVYDLNGRLVFSCKLESGPFSGDSVHRLNTEIFPNGLFLILLKNEDFVDIRKILIAKP